MIVTLLLSYSIIKLIGICLTLIDGEVNYKL